MYVKIAPSSVLIVITAIYGSGRSTGIRTLKIYWHDDNVQYDHFEIDDVFYVRDSSVNDLGALFFSHYIEDFKDERARISFSGKSLIFSWDHRTYICSFSNPDSA